MNQQQQIQLLNSIMPQIVETKDPEATMLKCARKNNLSPAQLEKLGQVYNTMKTLVGLEKQANRGDSFAILDVPAMISKYTTYNADAELSAQAEKVHAKVDSLTKDADLDGWGALLNIGRQPMHKAASSSNDWLYTSNRPIPRVHDWMEATVNSKGGTVEFEDDNDDVWMEASLESKPSTNSLFKVASAESALARARECWEQVHYEANVEIDKQCAELRSSLLQDREKWANLVMDARDILGVEKAAAALGVVEDYFDRVRCHTFEKAAGIDRGFTRRLGMDSTGLVPTLEEVMELKTLADTAASRLEFTQEKSAGAIATGVDNIDALLQQIRAVSKKPGARQKDYDAQADIAKRQTALEQLMLNDKIVSEADPALVQDLHATISSLSPTVASDPVRLAPVLKEALQYDALPIQQIKDLLSVEESAQKVKKLSRENEDATYA